jgi:hypothetical protein
MRWTFGPTRIAIALAAIQLLAVSPAAAQAKLERVIGTATSVRVQQAGSPGESAATVGMLLQPGDILRAGKADSVELRCAKGATTYFVQGPFRLFIDVPVEGRCNIDLANGHADVQAEEPTNITGGTIPLASKGTQYSVDVTRQAGELVCKVVVFEGEVIARAYNRSVAGGNKIQWTGAQVSTAVNSPEDLDRSASLYASFDLAAARTASPTETTPATFEQLKALHYAVLANPTDTAKRVALAKSQLHYKVDNQAAYNLKRANVTSDTALRRYQIDPTTVRPAIRDRIYQTVSPAVVRPEAAVSTPTPAATVTVAPDTRAVAATTTAPTTPTGVVGARTRGAATVSGSAGARAAVSRGAATVAATPPAAPPAAPTTDSDLALIASGQIDAAIQNLESRVAGPYATSRDHYALAKAYDGRDSSKVLVHAGRALSLHVTDGKLTDADLQAIRELMSRVE